MTRKPDDKEPLAGLAFKIMADQFQVCTVACITTLYFTLLHIIQLMHHTTFAQK